MGISTPSRGPVCTTVGSKVMILDENPYWYTSLRLVYTSASAMSALEQVG